MPNSATSRRALLASAWTVPVLAVVSAVPAHAASTGLTLTLLTTGLGAGGFTFHFREQKTANPVTPNTNPSNGSVVSAAFRVATGSGTPVPGATVTVVGDDTSDGTGNYMIGASNASTTGTLTQSPVKRTSTQTSDAGGQVTVKLNTATYSLASCAGGIPRTGTITVTVSAPGFATIVQTLSYRVFDASPLVNCVP